MADKRQLGILAAVVLFAITLGAAFFVVKSYLWSSGSEDLPVTTSNGGPSAAANGATGPQIQVGILLSDFSATGPHRQATQYGYQTQLRAVRYLRDPSIHLVPVIEPNTGKKGQLPRILAQNFAGETPLIATNPDDMRKLDVLSATAAANLREDVIKAISHARSRGNGIFAASAGVYHAWI